MIDNKVFNVKVAKEIKIPGWKGFRKIYESESFNINKNCKLLLNFTSTTDINAVYALQILIVN